MARGKGKNYPKEKKGKYKRDYDFVDYSSNDDMYQDDHISIASSSSSEHEDASSDSDTDHKEEDFISLNTEVDNRSRQQRRSDERAGMKRKRGDDDDTDDYDDSLFCYPWMDLMGSNRLRQPLSAIRLLQREVTCFVQYVEPTRIEIKLREYLVHRIRTSVQAKWPSATVSVFGSFSTTLYLPNSDIDLVVQFPPSTQLRLRNLASTLVQDDICRDPQVIEHASVPVIKFADTMTNLKVDIILNSTSGLDSADEINDMIARYPGLRPISLIVKHLLALRGHNEVFTGGLGGYAIVCLVVSFLQMHPKVASGAIDPMQNVGVLLLDFFQLYGLNFNLDETGVDVRGKGSYYDKSGISCRNGRAVFSIKDPLDASNDIGMKSYNSSLVIRAFKYAYLSMTDKAFAMETELRRNHYKKLNDKTLENHKRASILSSFLYISTDFMKQRQLMNDVYDEKRWEGQTAAKTFSFE
ncbi:Poly(A) polymerase [Mucor circinelloides]